MRTKNHTLTYANHVYVGGHKAISITGGVGSQTIRGCQPSVWSVTWQPVQSMQQTFLLEIPCYLDLDVSSHLMIKIAQEIAAG